LFPGCITSSEKHIYINASRLLDIYRNTIICLHVNHFGDTKEKGGSKGEREKKKDLHFLVVKNSWKYRQKCVNMSVKFYKVECWGRESKEK
jgi:hypothetical protein